MIANIMTNTTMVFTMTNTAMVDTMTNTTIITKVHIREQKKEY